MWNRPVRAVLTSIPFPPPGADEGTNRAAEAPRPKYGKAKTPFRGIAGRFSTPDPLNAYLSYHNPRDNASLFSRRAGIFCKNILILGELYAIMIDATRPDKIGL